MNLHPQFIIDASYLAAAFLFIYGLKRMSSPVTARSGIVVAGVGMLVATLASFLYVFGVADAARPHLTLNLALAAGALILGTGLSWWQGKRVAITAMPQMVALYNGMGGGSAAAIAAVELLRAGAQHTLVPLVMTVVGAIIGSISLSGSLIAWAKLDGKIDKTWRMHGQQILNGTVFLATHAIGDYIVFFAHGHADPRTCPSSSRCTTRSRASRSASKATYCRIRR
jgi:NAD(P) transhydrogenase subunit beta